ncbi:MAG: glycosyltransferase family A protein [Acetobacteraceae bacterium]|nr:glycosyltransferase family A protein [Acetobacteraceae bacterium]
MRGGVSVVVPTYNRAALIGETLDRILGQTTPPAEVIVVDDGSTDDTPAVLARYGDRIRAERIANSGELAARNYGVALARGMLIAFCDSDDLWQPDHLSRMSALWEREPELTAAYANFRIVEGGVWRERTKFDDAPEGYWRDLRKVGDEAGVFDRPVVDLLIRFMPFFPSALVVHADRFRALGAWDAAVNRWMSQDLATALRLAEHPPLGVLLAPTVGIRKHPGNFSADVQKVNLGDARVLDYVLATRPSLAPHAEAIRASIVRRRLDALELAFARRDWAGVREILALLPAEAVRGKRRLKARIAALPSALREPLARGLLALGTVKSALLGGPRASSAAARPSA